ncbi:MAG: hypothetical protein KatS3mg124_2055 [Porticoccaceae bacterium]|nr:MAG: hypothetical protein KatS3mg124_2055 [Porticoccaceae bacterium]
MRRVAAGAVVEAVEPGSPGAASGLRRGDRIVAANRRPVADVADLARALAVDPRVVLLQVERGEREFILVIR